MGFEVNDKINAPVPGRHPLADFVLMQFTDEKPVLDVPDLGAALAGARPSLLEYDTIAREVAMSLVRSGELALCRYGWMRPVVSRRIHLGCGDRHIPGWFHVDGRELKHVDLVADVRKLSMIATGSSELVYACHVLEHVGRAEVQGVLREWGRILRPDGVLRLAVPNLEVWFRVYRETGDLNLCLGSIYGRQDYPENLHKIGFDERTLTLALREAGFQDVRRWDWRTTEHAEVDDFSQAYYPHMDKVGGVLTSLNLEATKS